VTLDHHFARAIAVQLRARGHDVEMAEERGLHRVSDEKLLLELASLTRVLLTNNVTDFVPIVRRWAANGRGHAGLILTADSRLSRGRRGTGSFVERLDTVMRENPADDAFANRIHWL
jgi:hypothetical protein